MFKAICFVWIFWLPWSVFSQDSIQLYGPPTELVTQYNQAILQNDIQEQVRSLIRIGTHYEEHGMFEISERYMRRALAFSLEKNFYKYVGNILNSIALLYRYEGKYEESLALCFKAMEIESRLKYAHGVSQSQYNIATIFFLTDDYDRAMEYIEPAIPVDMPRDNKIYVINDLVLKALILVEMGQIDEARKQMNLPLAHYIAQADSNGLSMCYSNLAYIFHEAGLHDSSLTYAKTALSYAFPYDFNGTSIIQSNIAEQYLALAQYDSALVYAKRALVVTERIELKSTTMSLYGYLAEIYEHEGDYEAALLAHKQQIKLRDELLNSESISKIQTIESGYKLEQKEKTILLSEQKLKLLGQENQIANLKIYLLLALIFVAGIFSWFIYNSQKNRYLQKQKNLYQQKQLEIAKKELAEVQLQKTELQNKQLHSEVRYKTQELENLAHHIVQKNELLENLKEEFRKGQHSGMNQINQLINLAIDSDKNEFETHIDHINSLFYKNLKDEFPDLNANDLRLLSLLKINMSSKDISTVLNIAPKSVDMARYRLRKKLNIPAEMNLSRFLEKF